MSLRRLPFAAALLLGVLSLASSASATPEAGAVRPDPMDLRALRERLAPLPGRLAAVFAEAERDWRFARVETYAAYLTSDFEDRRREVRAKELLGYLTDATLPTELRAAAAKALTGSTPKLADKDIDLGRGSRSPRNDLSVQHVLPLLVAKDDAEGRRLASEYLVAMHGRQTDPDILSYKAGDPATWKPAASAWRRLLR